MRAVQKGSPAYVLTLTVVGIATLFVPPLVLFVFGPVPGFWGYLIWMAVWMTLFQSFVAAVVMKGAPVALRVWYVVAFVTATTFYNWNRATRGENWKMFSVVMTAVAISGGLLRLALRRGGSKGQAA